MKIAIELYPSDAPSIPDNAHALFGLARTDGAPRLGSASPGSRVDLMSWSGASLGTGPTRPSKTPSQSHVQGNSGQSRSRGGGRLPRRFGLSQRVEDARRPQPDP